MSNSNDEQGVAAERTLQELFRLAPRRQQPPRADESRIRAAIYADWTRQTRKRRHRLQFASWALAATVVLVAFLSVQMSRTPDAPEASRLAATVARLLGEVTRIREGTAQRLVSGKAAGQLTVGDAVVTRANSALALAWLSGGSLRMDEKTRLVIVSPQEIELLVGRVYFDSVPGKTRQADDLALIVTTATGVVRHRGTQFMARISKDVLTVSVREGSVVIDGDRFTGLAMAGQQIEIAADGGYEIGPHPGYGADWQWVESITPPLNIDGLTVLEFLSWVCRESGRQLKFESQLAARVAASSILNGRVELEPTLALRVFLQTTDLRSEIVDNVISVRLITADD